MYFEAVSRRHSTLSPLTVKDFELLQTHSFSGKPLIYAVTEHKPPKPPRLRRHSRKTSAFILFPRRLSVQSVATLTWAPVPSVATTPVVTSLTSSFQVPNHSQPASRKHLLSRRKQSVNPQQPFTTCVGAAWTASSPLYLFFIYLFFLNPLFFFVRR